MFPRIDGLRSIEFGTPGTSRETLVNLVLHGNKRATAGLLKDYEAENEPVEHVGEQVNEDTLVVAIYFDLLPEIVRHD